MIDALPPTNRNRPIPVFSRPVHLNALVVTRIGSAVVWQKSRP
jgi:hypothetical protein